MSLVLPWYQLTCYRAIGNAHEHFAVLRRCPNLVSVDLMFVSADLVFLTLPFLGTSDPQRLQLPRLPHLRFGNAEFLRMFSLPNLQDISAESVLGGDLFSPLLDLICRDHPPLVSISLARNSDALVAPSLISIIEHTPMLETLCVPISARDVRPSTNLS